MPVAHGTPSSTEEWGQAPAPGLAVSMPVRTEAPLPGIEKGALLVIRQFDIADEVDLAKAQSIEGHERTRLQHPRATALLLSNPPVSFSMGTLTVTLGDKSLPVDLSARVFDFGAVSVRMRLKLPPGTPWSVLAALVRQVQVAEEFNRIGSEACDRLQKMIAPACTGMHPSTLIEDYSVVFIERFTDGTSPQTLPLDSIAKLLLAEEDDVQLSASEIEEATRHRLSYYSDDLFVAGWNVALVVEPRGDTDPVDVLELANAQLLELRYYDIILDRELGRLYDEVAKQRRRWFGVLRSYGPLLRQTIALLLELAEFVERVENSLKIIGDVFLARVYASAVDSLRIPSWERTVTRKQQLVQQVYDVLKHEVDTSRDQLLEGTIVLLIVWEIFMAAVAQ